MTTDPRRSGTEALPGPWSALRFQVREGVERVLGGIVWLGLDCVEGIVRRLALLDEDDLLRTARHRSRLDTFGDTAFLEGLRALLQSLQNEVQLNVFGQIVARQNILGLLVNLLRLERDRAAYPAIAAQDIARPLFITGMPRSGSTLLHRLLAQDPANRVPQNWEMFDPSPPPDRDTYRCDPRIRVLERKMCWFHFLAPEFRKIHESDARLPEECVMILAHSFIATQFCSMFGVPSYQAWLNRQSLVPAYRFHRRFLQHLQVHYPGERWVLKAPTHMLGLRALLKVYPDACVIMTHRQPLEVLGSEASLQASLRRTFTRAVDPAAIGREVSESLAEAIRRGLEARDGGGAPPEQFFDVCYADLLQRPMAAVQRMYDHFGLKLSEEAGSRMRDFLATHPKARWGLHEYSLDGFDLRADEELERYRTYSERFSLHGCS